MERITSFDFALQALKDLEVLCSRSAGGLTRYRLAGERISVSGPNAHYLLTVEQFRDLFGRENFYIYDCYEQSIDPDKDDDYYAWKSRITN